MPQMGRKIGFKLADLSLLDVVSDVRETGDEDLPSAAAV